MKITVTIYANNVEVDVEPTTTIQYIKEKINEANGTPVENIHLYLSSHPLEDGVVGDYDIKEGSKLSVRIKFPNKEGKEKDEKDKKCTIM